ncbi:MAG: hypothetical protein ABJA89_18530, partial [Lapillicoccus sp.]
MTLLGLGLPQPVTAGPDAWTGALAAPGVVAAGAGFAVEGIGAGFGVGFAVVGLGAADVAGGTVVVGMAATVTVGGIVV